MVSVAGDNEEETVETNPMKKAIPKRPKAHEFLGCSSLKEYDLQEKIGEGTFGVVHKARHRKTRDMVALKRIIMHNEKDGFPITALREIKVLKMLSHPNVIRLSDMTVERGDKSKKKRGSIFMVTPYMDHDLCGLLANPKVKFSVPQIKCYIRQLLEGTRYLHSMRILHRDMKAANLLISNQGILQIADFGLARMLHEDPPPGELAREYTNMVVTRWYRPPELLLGERRYTPAIDVWGIGCILAEMYKGGPILQGSSDLDQLGRIFDLCGNPTEANMPGWTKLPGCEGIRSFKECSRQLEKQYAEYGEDAVSLLSALMTLDPAKRITAAQALEHEYFKTDPLPANPADLPTYETSHEIDKRRAKAPRDMAPRPPDAAGQMVPGNGNAQSMAPRESRPPSVVSVDRRREDIDHGSRASGRDSRDNWRDRPRGWDRDRPRYDERPSNHSYRDDRHRGGGRSRERDRFDAPYARRSSREDRDRDRRSYDDSGRDRRAPVREYYDDRRPRKHDRDEWRKDDRARSRSRSRDGRR